MGWKYRTYPQLILNLLVVRGCVATAGRHSLLCLHCLLIYKLTNKLQFLFQFKIPNSDGGCRPPCKYRTKSKNMLQNKN